MVLTRKNAGGLYGLPTPGFKRRDMEERRRIIREAAPDLVISVHQNSFPAQPSRSGAQVYYKKGDAAASRLAACIAAPLSICTAIYLVEYAKRGNRLVGIIRMTAETLSGIPSIVYGLFGMLFFVTAVGFGYSLLSGALTLSIMILPLIMRTTEEALLAVPDTYREASFGLGAGRLRTVFTIVLPSAVPGILAGVILAIGRVVGETAALIYTAGTVADIPSSIMGSGRTLAIHMWALSSEGLYTNQAYATAVVLLVTVLAINFLSAYIAKKLTKG